MPRRFGSFAASALAAIAFATALPEAQDAPAPRTLAGRVTSRDTAALPRVRVAVRDSTNRVLQAVMTDDNGRFTLTLPMGDVEVTLSKAGYAMQKTRVAAADLAVGRRLDAVMVRGAAIVGRVADLTGDALPAVQVTARREGESYSGDTDDRGEYRIGGLPEGQYTVSALPFRQPGAPPPPPPQPVTIALTAGDTIGEVNFAMAGPLMSVMPGQAAPSENDRSSIRGHITNAAGRPVAGAVVRAMRSSAPVRSALTDDAGGYTITGLSAGEYIVSSSKTGYVTLEYGQDAAMQRGRVVAVRDAQAVERIDIVLPRGSAIEGTVVDEFGEPIQGAMVDVLQVRTVAGLTRALRLRGRATNDLGRYRVFGLLPGPHVVRVQIPEALANVIGQGYAPTFYPGGPIEQAVRIPIAMSRDALNTDIIVRPSRTARVTGTAVDASGAPLKGTVILVTSERSGGIQVEPLPGQLAPDGSFGFTNVPPGDYVVQAMGQPLAGARGGMASMPEFTAQYVTITDADPAPLALKTSRGASLRGRIRLEGGDLATTRVTLQAAPANFDRAPMVGFGAVGFTVQQDGTFEYLRLTGPRRLVLSSGLPGAYLKTATVKGQDMIDTPFDFGLEDVVFDGAEIVVSTAGASIGGRVNDARGDPVSEYSAIVFPTSREKWYTGSRFIKLGRPTQDGSFRVEGLPPADYFVAAVDRIDTGAIGEWQSAELLETLVTRASRVTLSEGESRTETLRVIPR